MKGKKILSLILCFTLCFGCLLMQTQAADDPHYGYDETPAQSVTVRVTISNDGLPIRGSDEANTVLAGLEVTVPYFDLDLYGLSEFYRCGTSGGSGAYVSAQPIERPTALHLFIYLLERYYIGLEPALCGKGIADVLHYSDDSSVEYLDGATAYESDGKSALSIQGSATHLYMTNFWGHDENLMYFRNHVYPLMSANYGATSDYMLLSDGDTIDIAMFSDWDFFNHGAFVCFDQDTYTAAAGKPLAFSALRYDTRSVSEGGAEALVPVSGLEAAVYDAQWNKVEDLTMTDSAGTFTPKEPGLYYLLLTQPSAGEEAASYTPGVARVTVGTALNLSASQAEFFAGDTVTLTLTLGSTLENVVSFDWQLRFDGALFALQSAELGSSNAEVRVSNRKSDADGAYYSISYVDRTSAGGSLNAGTVCTLTFRAAENLTQDQTAAFSLVSEGVFDAGFDPIPVSAGEPVSVSVKRLLPEKLVLTKLPDKTSYHYKDALDTSGMELTIVYNSGKTETVTNGFTCTPNRFTVQNGLPLFGLRGSVPVTVSYKGLQTSFSVEVRLTALQWLIKIVLFGWLWY